MGWAVEEEEEEEGGCLLVEIVLKAARVRQASRAIPPAREQRSSKQREVSAHLSVLVATAIAIVAITYTVATMDIRICKEVAKATVIAGLARTRISHLTFSNPSTLIIPSVPPRCLLCRINAAPPSLPYYCEGWCDIGGRKLDGRAGRRRRRGRHDGR
jgi:hypothetical protein